VARAPRGRVERDEHRHETECGRARESDDARPGARKQYAQNCEPDCEDDRSAAVGAEPAARHKEQRERSDEGEACGAEAPDE
jgi:hypothetical protein